MIRIILALLVLVSSASAITKQESGILKAVSSKYFKNDGVPYHLQYMKGKPQGELYEFTNVKWRTFPIKLTQADIKNGITKKLHVKLLCDTAYRIKKNNKWSPWKQRGEYKLIWFNGQIIYDRSGVNYVPNIPAALNNYPKPSNTEGSIKSVKKNTSDALPSGVKRMPTKK
ncbi:MAG: hypothetical protein ACSHX0_00960 [Akkermansiaceae bacterium]